LEESERSTKVCYLTGRRLRHASVVSHPEVDAFGSTRNKQVKKSPVNHVDIHLKKQKDAWSNQMEQRSDILGARSAAIWE